MSFAAQIAASERLERFKAIQRTRDSLSEQVQTHVLNITAMMQEPETTAEERDELIDELNRVVDEIDKVKAIIPALENAPAT